MIQSERKILRVRNRDRTERKQSKGIGFKNQSMAELQHQADVWDSGGYLTKGKTQHTCTRYITHSWHASRNVSITIAAPHWKISIKDTSFHHYPLKCHDVLIRLKDSIIFPGQKTSYPCKVLHMCSFTLLSLF